MVSYIISHRVSNEDRNDNLKFILKWLNEITFIKEVIIIEQDDKSKLFDVSDIKLNYTLTHHFLYNPGEFNKSWAYNYGAKVANHNYLGFGDNDLFMSPKDLIESYNKSKHLDSFDPYDKVYDCGGGESDIIRNGNIYDYNTYNTQNIRPCTPYGGGIFFIKRDKMFSVGGWDERFIGWGGEDDDISTRIKKRCSYKENENPSFHLHHKESESKYKYRVINKSIMGSNISRSYTKSDMENLGLSNKYKK